MSASGAFNEADARVLKTLQSFSKLELKRELEAPSVIERVGNLAEGWRAEVTAGLRELRRVEEVDGVGVEREIHFGLQRPGAGERGIHVANAAAAEGIESEIAAGIRGLDESERRARQ